MNEPIPAFEGRPVDYTVIKLKGTSPMEDLEGITLSIDDCVQMISMFRVIGVQHMIDESSGKLVRIQTLRPVESALHPLDMDDPEDDGIIRAIPRAIMGEVQD